MAVDYDFFREIINNLVGNAIKYTPEGGEIKVNVKGDGDKVVISVADNGIGIPSDDLAHIFQKFYRVDNTQTREIGGTGLGLYLVKQRVEALGGRVWVESDFGHGSTFYVALPRISESEYERMRIAYGNEKMVHTPFVAPVVGTAAIDTPPAGVSRTVTTPSTTQIQPAQASAPATSDNALTSNTANPTTNAVTSTPTNTPSSATTSSPTPSSTPDPTSANQPAPAVPHSSMIQSHKMLTSETPDESPPDPETPAEEPPIFERKAATLTPPPQINPTNTK